MAQLKAGTTIGGRDIVREFDSYKRGIEGALGTNGIEGNPIGWNLLPNSSFRLGSAFWSDQSGGKLSLFPPDVNGGGLGLNTNITNQTIYWESIKIPLAWIVPMTISADISAPGVSSGSARVEVAAYDSTGAYIGIIGSVIATNGTGWARYSGTFTPPANAAYVTVRVTLSNATATANNVGWKRIKLEMGSVATPYTAEADLWPMLTHGAGGSPVVAVGQNNGIKIQYGYVNIPSGSTSAVVSFPITFSVAPIVFVQSTSSITFNTVNGVSTTGFTVYQNSSISSLNTIYWIAIGN